MRIIVVGGGIGGLALGAGLRRHGFDVGVFDRDTDVTATGGYHITLDGRAQSALRDLVAPEVVERLLASASALRLRGRDAFWDRRGRLLGHGPELVVPAGSTARISTAQLPAGRTGEPAEYARYEAGPPAHPAETWIRRYTHRYFRREPLCDDPGVDVDRVTLRTLLAGAVGDDLHLGRAVTGIGRAEDGSPLALFADAPAQRCDLLVGADGTHSLVARHLAGGPTNSPAGIIGFSGRTRADDLAPAERHRLGPRSGLAIGPRGAALYVGFLDPVGNAVLDAPDLRAAITTGPTYIWGAMFPESAATDSLRAVRGGALQDALLAGFRRRGWGERPLEVIARADPDSVAAFRFHAASSRAHELAPWTAGRVTALGDAVHATPPTAGMGAGAAIRDAASLVAGLRGVAAGDVTLDAAVGRFEADMRVCGSEVVARGMRTVRAILATDTRLGAATTAAVTPVLAVAARMRRRR